MSNIEEKRNIKERLDEIEKIFEENNIKGLDINIAEYANSFDMFFAMSFIEYLRQENINLPQNVNEYYLKNVIKFSNIMLKTKELVEKKPEYEKDYYVNGDKPIDIGYIKKMYFNNYCKIFNQLFSKDFLEEQLGKTGQDYRHELYLIESYGDLILLKNKIDLLDDEKIKELYLSLGNAKNDYLIKYYEEQLSKVVEEFKEKGITEDIYMHDNVYKVYKQNIASTLIEKENKEKELLNTPVNTMKDDIILSLFGKEGYENALSYFRSIDKYREITAEFKTEEEFNEYNNSIDEEIKKLNSLKWDVRIYFSDMAEAESFKDSKKKANNKGYPKLLEEKELNNQELNDLRKRLEEIGIEIDSLNAELVKSDKTISNCIKEKEDFIPKDEDIKNTIFGKFSKKIDNVFNKKENQQLDNKIKELDTKINDEEAKLNENSQKLDACYNVKKSIEANIQATEDSIYYLDKSIGKIHEDFHYYKDTNYIDYCNQKIEEFSNSVLEYKNKLPDSFNEVDIIVDLNSMKEDEINEVIDSKINYLNRSKKFFTGNFNYNNTPSEAVPTYDEALNVVNNYSKYSDADIIDMVNETIVKRQK